MRQTRASYQSSSLKKALDTINASRQMGPGNILVLYRTGDAVGQAVAQYYQQQRAIPAANVIALTLAWTPTGNDMTAADANSILAVLMPIIQSADIRAVVTCNWFPQTINGGLVNFGAFLSSMWMYDSIAVATRYSANIAVSPLPFSSDYASTVALAFPAVEGAFSGASQYGLKPPSGYVAAYQTATYMPHFRLEVSPVAVGDTRIPSASVENYLKKIINDSMTAEATNYQDAGMVIAVASGSGSGALVVALPTALEGIGKAAELYCNGVAVEVDTIPRSANLGTGIWWRTVTGNHLVVTYNGGITAATEPAWNTSRTGAITVDGAVNWLFIGNPPQNAFPTGATTNTPNKIGGTYIPISNVFFRTVGGDAYYDATTQPEQQSDMGYRTGAIVMFSQSYGYTPNPIAGLDYDFGAPLPNAMADTACVALTPIQYTNANGFVINGFSFISTAATPTVGVSGSDILLKSAGTVVATIALSGTMRQQYAAIQAALPTGWTMSCNDPFSESRCSNAIKCGAAVALGACAEPFTTGAIKGYGLQDLWDGASIGEVAYTWANVTNYTTAAFNLYMVGDPLYRPFVNRQGA